MPRIDPHQLLTCLTILLTPTGGILSKNEVQRLANLMTKFSKKLVSKCVYVLILRNTEPPLLGSFMVEGGWNLVHVWLQDGYNNKNWPLVSELLELLLMSPTTVEQLKTNNLPKLVKSLSKRDDLERVKDLANQLVQKWLKIVKDDQSQKNQAVVEKTQVQAVSTPVTASEPVQVVEVPVVQVEQESACQEPEAKVINKEEEEEEDVNATENAQACYKLAVRDGKHILCKVSPDEANVMVVENAIIEDITLAEEVTGNKSPSISENTDVKEEKELENKEPIELEKKKEKSNHDRHKDKINSSKSSSLKSSSSRDKDRKSSSRDKSKDKDRSSKSKERSSKDHPKDKSRSDRDKHRSNGSLKSSSSNSKSSSSSSSSSSSKDKDKTKKETKEKQAEKDKDTLTKIQPQTLQKIGRIPKRNSEDSKDNRKEETKKPTFSIEVRKNSEEKPKTVKVFNAKMRSTGLLEEAKPPPPRPVKKSPSTLPSIPQKRPSPIRDLIPPPEKKVKLEPVERPGAIKLIPPKPKHTITGKTAQLAA